MKKELIYVGGPFTSDTQFGVIQNVQTAIAVSLEIYKLGHIPVIPHLTYYVEEYTQKHGINMCYRDWMEWDDAIRERCDSMFKIAPSPGTDEEEEKTLLENKHVYHSLNEIKPYKE